jgi:hypothetical protein
LVRFLDFICQTTWSSKVSLVSSTREKKTDLGRANCSVLRFLLAGSMTVN